MQTRSVDDALKLQQDSKLLPETTLRNTELSDFMQKMVVTDQRVQLPVDGLMLNSEQKADINLLGLQQTSRAVTTAMQNTAEAKPVQTFVSSPLEGNQWGKQFTDRVVWLATNGVQTAEIRLNPQHLGPIEVRVVMNDDIASVTLVAQNHAVREAMESALPRLREMFAATGLQLSDAHVSDQSLQQQNREGRGGERQQDGASEQLSDTDSSAEALVSELNMSMFEPPPDISKGLDLYA